MIRHVRTGITIFIAGIAFYFVDSYLVGFAAAVAFPSWYANFATQYSQLGLAIWDIVTIVPVTIAVSLVIGAILAKFIDRRFFVSGLAAVLVAMMFGIFTASPSGNDLLVTIRNHALPLHWFQVPGLIVLWLSLPMAVHYFGNRTGPA